MKNIKMLLFVLILGLFTACSTTDTFETRKFVLKTENLKDTKGFLNHMINRSRLKMENPSNHILYTVMNEKERNFVFELAKKEEFEIKDSRKVRKLMNKILKRENFFDERSWLGTGVSSETLKLMEATKKEEKSSKELSNLNGRALFVAYPEYFSDINKWSK